MSWQIGFVYGLAIAAVIALATEKLTSDVVALLVASALLVSGVLTPEEGFAGFANPATIAVGAMFVLSAGLAHTGAVDGLGATLERIAARSIVGAQLVMMLGVGVISAFLNNTAAVAILIPVIIAVAERTKTSASQWLMPLSFASMFGGVCTLIGTSTNLLGSSIAERHGQPAFGMFEFSSLGLIFFAVGTAYMFTIGRRLVPSRRGAEGLTTAFGLGVYVTDVTISADAASAGKSLHEAPLLAGNDIQVLQVLRGERHIALPSPDFVLNAGDVLRLLCRVDDIARLRDRAGITFSAAPPGDEKLESDEIELAEVIVAPNSLAVGRMAMASLRELGATVLALRKRRGELVRGAFRNITLRPGDALLLELPRARLEAIPEAVGVLARVAVAGAAKTPPDETNDDRDHVRSGGAGGDRCDADRGLRRGGCGGDGGDPLYHRRGGVCRDRVAGAVPARRDARARCSHGEDGGGRNDRRRDHFEYPLARAHGHPFCVVPADVAAHRDDVEQRGGSAARADRDRHCRVARRRRATVLDRGDVRRLV